MAFRNREDILSSRTPVQYYFELNADVDVLSIHKNIEIDLLKEISVNTNILSNIRTHSPENIYAEIYAAENDLDDVILLNPDKRVARTISGNLLLLEENTIKIPKRLME